MDAQCHGQKREHAPNAERTQAHLALQLVSFDNSLGGPTLAKASPSRAKNLFVGLLSSGIAPIDLDCPPPKKAKAEVRMDVARATHERPARNHLRIQGSTWRACPREAIGFGFGLDNGNES